MSHKETISSEAQFQQIFEQFARSLRNFLYYKCGDAAMAEDLMQEAFLRLWKKREQVEIAKAKSFLFTVGNNLFLDHIKHQKVVLKFQQKTQKQVSNETPQYMMEVEEFHEKLQRSLAKLTEKNRVVFLMNRVDKLSYPEIAERLGISVKAVEKRMSKALVEMRKLVKNI